MTEQDNRKIKEAISSCLSGVDALPSMRADILRAAKGEKKVKRSLNKGLVLALVLILMMSTVAVAAGVGLFGQLSEREDSDARLTRLENVSAVMDKVITTEEGVTITINQAYYDGNRVFISYIKEGPFDQYELGEGDPGIDKYDWENPGAIYGETFGSESASHQELVKHLDGSAPRWAKTRYVNIHDGLQIGDEYLDIIGGDTYLTEDGKMVGWKECVVPAELAADEVTFSIGVFTSNTTYYQTADCLYTSFGPIGKTAWYDFTVKKDERSTALTGTAQTADWTATADLTASAIDVKGEVIVECPEAWTDIWSTWENPEKIDYIQDWKFYVGGVKVDGYNLDGGIRVLGDGKISCGVCYKLDSLPEDMKLVPVYRYAGEKVEEAIVLQVK